MTNRRIIRLDVTNRIDYIEVYSIKSKGDGSEVDELFYSEKTTKYGKYSQLHKFSLIVNGPKSTFTNVYTSSYIRHHAVQCGRIWH